MSFSHIRSEGLLAGGNYAKTSAESLAAEARELERCTRLQISTENVRAITLVSFDPARNELTTKWVAGKSLFNELSNAASPLGLLRRSWRRRAVLAARLAEVGAWLARYHQAAGPRRTIDERESNPQAIARGVSTIYLRKLDRLEEYRALDSQTLRRLKSWGHSIETVLAASRLQRSTIHGDLVLHNLVIDARGAVHVLDFADSRPGFRLEDVVRLWTQLEELALLGGRLGASWIRKAGAAFLDSYGLPPECAGTPEFDALRRVNAVTNFLTALAVRDHARTRWRFGLSRLIGLQRRWLEEIGVLPLRTRA